MLQQAKAADINLSHRQWEAWQYLSDGHTTEIFYGGAAGGGKSFLGCLWHIDRRLRYPGSRGMIGRAKISDLELSTLKTFFDVCSSMGYIQGVHFHYNAQKHIIRWINGSETILKDLFYYPSDPEFTSLGSTEYTDVFIDEGAEIKLKAFDIVNSRIRYRLSELKLVPKIFVTCNPSPGWIKDNYLFDPLSGEPIQLKHYQKFIRALVTDNPDPEFIALYSSQLARMHSQYDIDRLLYGDWNAVSESQNPFAHQFDPLYHVGDDMEVDPVKQLIISIDFNLNPFAVSFWHFFQNLSGYHLWGLDEAEIQNGSLPAMADLIRSRYGSRLHSCIITGDSMGNNRNIQLRDNSSNYKLLIKDLNLSPSQLRVPQNPTHENSRADVNQVLAMSKEQGSGISFKMHRTRMRNTIQDFKIVQCDAFGGIIKKDRNDIAQRADHLDTARSVINTFLRPVIMRMRK